MLQAAGEVHVLTDTNKVAVTCGGTWMRRGHSSLYGVFVCILWRTGRVVDVHVSGKFCLECALWSDKKESGSITEEAYVAWKSRHACMVNTTASAPGMKKAAATILWARSVDTLSLMYTTYIGDGDSKGFSAVVASDPYDGEPIVKEECVGHVQKRIGSNLRELKRNLKGKKLSDGKPLIGKGRLTDKVIDTLQTYYDWAVREHHGDLQGMARAIWGGLMHRCSHASMFHR